MGLEQRLELYSFDGPDQQGFPLSAPERLSWFVGESTRLISRIRQPVQTVIQGFTVSALILSGAQDLLPRPAFAQPLPQSTENTRLITAENPAINPLTLELSSRVTQEIVKPLADLGLNIDVTGELLTNAWVDDQGNRNILYRNIWFMVGMDGKLKIFPVIREIRKKIATGQLDPTFLGDPIPPVSDAEIQVGSEIKQFTQNLKNVFSVEPITGYKNYGPFESYADEAVLFIRVLEGEESGSFRFGNVGYQAILAGLVDQKVLSSLPFATGGGTTETQPGLVFETLQSGKGKQTEWVIQKAPDSPITPVVQRPDALAHVADTYLPKGNLKKVKINFLPMFEGNEYQGLDFSSNGIGILLTDSIYGPTVGFKAATVQRGDTLEIYFSVGSEKSLQLMQDNDAMIKVNNGLSSYAGTLIAEAGGYPRIGAGRVAPEAAALESNSNGQLPAIALALV